LEYNNALRSIAAAAFPDLSEHSRNLIIKPIFLRGLIDDIKKIIKFRDFKSMAELVRYIPQKSTISTILPNSHLREDMAQRQSTESILREIQATVNRLERSREPVRIYCRYCRTWGFHRQEVCWYRSQNNHFETPGRRQPDIGVRRPPMARRAIPFGRRGTGRPASIRPQGDFSSRSPSNRQIPNINNT